MERGRVTHAVAMVVLSLGVWGCSKAVTPPATTHSISGTVTTSAGPLANVKVRLVGASVDSAITSGSGGYSFGGLASGSYTLTASRSGYAFSPAGRLLDTSGGSASGANFSAAPAVSAHQIAGTVSGAGGVTMTLSGDNAGAIASGAGGGFAFTGLLVGDYTLTPSKTGYHFTPPSRAVTGTIAFDHPETGNGTLGTVTLTSVTWGAQDATLFFEITSPPVDGVGTIRARRQSEIAPGSLAGYTTMWNTGGVVIAQFQSDFGPDTIEITLGPNPTVSVSSNRFLIHEALTDSTGNDFVAVPH